MTRTQNRSALRLLVVVVALMTVTGAFAPLAAAQDDSPPAPPHAVYGTVTDDAGDPVEGVTVEAIHDGEVVASDTTDADGYYDVDVEGPADGDEFTVSPTTSSESETLTFSSGSAEEVNFGDADSPDDGDGTDGGTPTPTATPGGGGGGGGGGAGGGTGGATATPTGPDDDEPVANETVPIEDAEPDAPGLTVAFDDLTLEEIVFSNASASGEVTVAEFDDVPADRPALPAGFLIVSVADITVPEAQQEEPATLRMTISRERLDELGIEEPDLAVFRLPDGGDSWGELDAAVTETDAGVTVEFETPGFSTFAVAQQEQTPTPTDTDVDGTDTPTDTDEGPTATDDGPSESGFDLWQIGAILLFVLLVVAGVAYYFTRQSG